MSSLAITMGISGSGKTSYTAGMEEDGFVRICPDDIRKEFTGDISDQSQNGRVWKEAYLRVREELAAGNRVIFDSTATRAKTRKELLTMGKEFDCFVALIVFNDSRDIELCRSRVAKDIEDGVDRSNTLVEDFILDRQHNQFMESLKVIKTEGYDAIIEPQRVTVVK